MRIHSSSLVLGMFVSPLALVALVSLGCSSSSSPNPVSGTDAGADVAIDVGSDAAKEAAPGTVVEHGIMVDYATLNPAAGLSITDNGQSTTTDATGAWSLTVPADAKLQPIVTGPKYSLLYFPDSKPEKAGADVDFGTAVSATADLYNVESGILAGIDTTKALIHLVVVTTGTCTSPVGGTLKVTAPADAKVSYFGESSIPDDTVTSFQKVAGDRPVAVIYNVTPGADVAFTIDHPTCKLAPYPVTFRGKTYDGKVRTEAIEPKHLNSAMVAVLQ